MKSAYYVGCVVNIGGRLTPIAPRRRDICPIRRLWKSCGVATRQFTTEILLETPHEEGQDIQKSLMDPADCVLAPRCWRDGMRGLYPGGKLVRNKVFTGGEAERTFAA